MVAMTNYTRASYMSGSFEGLGRFWENGVFDLVEIMTERGFNTFRVFILFPQISSMCNVSVEELRSAELLIN